MMVLGVVLGRSLGQGDSISVEENPSIGDVSTPEPFAAQDNHFPSSDQSAELATQPDQQLPAPGGLFDPDPPADIRMAQADMQQMAAATDVGDGSSANSPASNARPLTPSSSIDLLDTDVFGSQVALADEQLRIGNYGPALQMYQLLAESTSGAMLAPLQFRLALCAELSGSFSEAIEAYQRVSGSSIALDWNGLAILGEARCLIASERFDVLQGDLFRRTLLDETAFTQSVRLELFHLIGRSLWSQLALARSQDLLNDQTLIVPVWHPDPNAVLDKLPRLLAKAVPSVQSPILTILQVSEPNPDGIYLKVHSAPASVEKLLSGILQRCELKMSLTESAERAIVNRRMTLNLKDRSLSLILDALTVPYGNVWQVSDASVRIMSFSELSPEQLLQFRREAAERILRIALLEGPDSEQSGHSRLALGILQFDQGRVGDAAYTFRSQLEKATRSIIEAETAYNIGKCLLNLGDAEEARRAFLMTVDTSGGSGELKVAAYLYAGRLQIELGDTRGAISTLMRALRLSESTYLEPHAALLLASNYLMIGNPAGTNSILMERREVLQEPEFKYAGAFLSSAAQLQAAVLPAHREREGRDVVEAISQFDPSQQFGAHWCLLVGEAAEDLGLTETATTAYLKTLAKEPAGPLRNQVMLKLATRYRIDERLDEARGLLESLEPQQAGEFGLLAMLRSAEIAVQQGNSQEAILTCRQLLENELSSEVRRATLRTMGQAYEQQKNYAAAVYCFSGSDVPETVAARSQTDVQSDSVIPVVPPSVQSGPTAASGGQR